MFGDEYDVVVDVAACVGIVDTEGLSFVVLANVVADNHIRVRPRCAHPKQPVIVVVASTLDEKGPPNCEPFFQFLVSVRDYVDCLRLQPAAGLPQAA
jgi:hypothetical protein